MLIIKKYNRNLSVDYALKFAVTRNGEYHDYTNEGGNCTNYVSQCLYAGASVMNYDINGWYYLSPQNTSVSWANVEPLYQFITNNKGVGIFGVNAPLEMCGKGDIIQLKFKNKNVFSHCLFVTKIKEPTPKQIYVCANTRDVKEVPLSFYTYEKYRLIHILGYRENVGS